MQIFKKYKMSSLESHPDVDGSVATRHACMRDGSNLCRKQYEIQILKCGSFYLYNLSRTDTCDIAYCFGKNAQFLCFQFQLFEYEFSENSQNVF